MDIRCWLAIDCSERGFETDEHREKDPTSVIHRFCTAFSTTTRTAVAFVKGVLRNCAEATVESIRRTRQLFEPGSSEIDFFSRCLGLGVVSCCGGVEKLVPQRFCVC